MVSTLPISKSRLFLNFFILYYFKKYMDTNYKHKKNIGWLRILLFFVPYFMVIGLFQFIAYLIIGIDMKDINFQKTTEQHLIISVFNLAGHLLILWYYMDVVHGERLTNLGLSIKNRFIEFSVGVGLAILIIGVSFVSLLTLDEIQIQTITFNHKEFMYSIIIFIIIAFVEELVFRGYFLANLMLSFNKYIALIISSILFTLFHGLNPNISWISLLSLFFSGLVLGASYIYTKNLWFPIGMHFSWNFFQSILGYNVSGQDFYSIIEYNFQISNILNGGEFGFEASIFSIALEILVLCGIIYYYERKSKFLLKE